jgi:hypothetical protein
MNLGWRSIPTKALASLATLAWILLSSTAVSSAETLQRPAETWMLTPVVDRPEMRSYQPYSGLQFGFRPTAPIQRGVKSKRPRVVMPKRVGPTIEYGRATPYSAQGYAYCADPPGDFEPRTGPYDSRPIERRQCP